MHIARDKKSYLRAKELGPKIMRWKANIEVELSETENAELNLKEWKFGSFINDWEIEEKTVRRIDLSQD